VEQMELTLTLVKIEATPPAPSPQFAWHRKPKGDGALCSVCGCATPRLQAEHRALRAGEWTGGKTPSGDAILWVKRVRIAFGADMEEVGLDR
jgi:hypothetical protein